MKKLFSLLLGLLACHAHAQVTIDVDLSRQGHSVSPTLYGIFFEDINHAADGGLYAELIRNRSFEEIPSDGRRRGDQRRAEHRSETTAWSAVGSAEIGLTTEELLNEAQGHALKLNVRKAGDGVQNEGFWGMSFVEGETYTLTCWAKANNDGFTGNVMMKGIEGMGLSMLGSLKEMFYKNTRTKLAALLLKKELGELKKTYDVSEVGGTILLGIRRPVVKAHGSSDARAIRSAIAQAWTAAQSSLIEDITKSAAAYKAAQAAD